MKTTLSLILCATFLLACNQITDIDTYLQGLHEKGKLNGTVLVIQNDTVLYEQAFGYADGAKEQPLTPDHRFALGSIYKEFPAVAVMQLQEQGLLSLDDPLSRFMPQLPLWANKIKVGHLMQYSSGLPKIDWKAYFQKGIRVKESQIVGSLVKLEALEFEPGSDYLYSNYNPFLLISIVENLTGMPFKAYVEQKMIQPFALEGIVVKEAYPYEDTSLMAMPFDEDFKVDDYEVESTTICSSARGMYKWFSQLDGFKIITKASMKQVSQVLREGDYIQSPLGYCSWEGDDIKQHFHHGNSQNYECLVRNYKQEGLMVILMTNQEHENLYDIADNIYAFIRRSAAKE